MRLILTGCEYAGKRTLGRQICKKQPTPSAYGEWWNEQTGVELLPPPHTAFHDHWDLQVVELMPDMVLVLMKASPEVILKRMRSNPHEKSLLQEKDVEFVLARFQEEFDNSLIDRRFTLDTTSATVEETLEEFRQQIEPYLTPKDRLLF